MKPKEIYEKFVAGDPLSDCDLDVGIEHFSRMARLLFASGPIFRLAAIEASRVELRLREYEEARNENDSQSKK